MAVSLSVVIAVRNAARHLHACLQSIRESSTAPLEVIVVDDCSDDRPQRVAAMWGASVTRLAVQSGPSRARNAGAAVARGDVVVFIDADVCVHPDTLQRLKTRFEAEPDVDAVFGSYGELAGADNFISRYKNLQHHFIHQHASADAWTFWSGCGGVRRQVFLEHGGFSTTYRRPAVEDIEFGMRLFRAGHKLRLDRRVQATHMKRWTFSTLVRSDTLDRAAPWTELLLAYRRLPDDLNLGWTQRLSVGASLVLLTSMIGGCIHLGPLFAAPVAALLMVALAPCGVELLRVRTRGQPGAFERQNRVVELLGAGAAVCIVGHVPWHWLSVLAGVSIVLITWLNLDFYRFLAARWGLLNALSAVPFHLMYFMCCASGALIGAVRYGASFRARTRPRTDMSVDLRSFRPSSSSAPGVSAGARERSTPGTAVKDMQRARQRLSEQGGLTATTQVFAGNVVAAPAVGGIPRRRCGSGATKARIFA
jgi:cellulose synthase/poly-beta-1,6-N-acetylglucosamine synthase-like glycosyltransferase